MVKLTINNREVEAPEGSTILEAARLNGIQIPTLCFLLYEVLITLPLSFSFVYFHCIVSVISLVFRFCSRLLSVAVSASGRTAHTFFALRSPGCSSGGCMGSAGSGSLWGVIR